MKDRRLGRFEVSREVIHNHTQSKAIKLLMSNIIVVRCEFDYATDCFKYTAISDHFAECQEHCEIPEYRWIIHKDDMDRYRLEAERLTDPPTLKHNILTKRRRIIEEL